MKRVWYQLCKRGSSDVESCYGIFLPIRIETETVMVEADWQEDTESRKPIRYWF